MLDLMFKFYNQRDTIHCLFDPKSCDVFEFLVMLKKFLDQEKSLTERKNFSYGLICLKHQSFWIFIQPVLWHLLVSTKKNSTLEKLNMIVADNHLMVEFISFAYKIHWKSWCDLREEHTENWRKRDMQACKIYKTNKESVRPKHFHWREKDFFYSAIVNE